MAQANVKAPEADMADNRTMVRRWGADWAQLQAELALIDGALPDCEDHDDALERLVAVERSREDFRRRTHQPEPPRWE